MTGFHAMMYGLMKKGMSKREAYRRALKHFRKKR